MFAHFLAASIVDVKAPPVMADCSKQNVAVRLCRPLIIFRRVKCYQVVVPRQSVLRPFMTCSFEALCGRADRHGEDDPTVVRATIGYGFFLRNLRLKAPLTNDGFHLFFGTVGKAVLVFNLDLAVSADVISSGLHVFEAANIGSPDFQHDFRCPSNDAREFLPGSQSCESRATAPAPTLRLGSATCPL